MIFSSVRRSIFYLSVALVLSVALPQTSWAVNTVSNGGFETGRSPWVFYTNGAGTFANDASGDVSPSAAHITINTPGTNVQMYQAGLAIEGNTQYRLSFKAYSNTGHDVSLSLQKHGSPYTSYGLSSRLFDLTSAWQAFSVEFTTSGFSGTINDGRLMFWLAPYDAGGDHYYFDDVVLEKVTETVEPPAITTHPADQSVLEGQTATFNVAASGTTPLSYQWQKNGIDISGAASETYTTPAAAAGDSGAAFRCIVTNAYGNAASNTATVTVTTVSRPAVSLISNGGFESGRSPWVFYTNGSGTFANDAAGDGSPGAAHISIATPGTNVQMHQAGLELEANTLYRLSFKAYSNTGNDVSISIHKHGSPYTGYGLSGRVFNLTAAWQAFSVEFTTSGFSGSVNDGRLLFWLAPYAASGDHYYFDDIVLEKAAATPAITPPVIKTQPVSQIAVAGQKATFSVAATGTAPLSYQWQKDGLNISGATSASYTTPATAHGDSGAIFWCNVTDVNGTTMSNAATLTVTGGVIINGGFEEGRPPWTFYTNGTGAFLTDAPGDGSPSAGLIKILTTGTNVQLYQAGLELEPYTQYLLSFKAYSNTGHDVSVSLHKHGAPYTSYGLSGYLFDLTTSWGNYSVEFSTSGFAGSANDGRLLFWLTPYHASGDEYFFDDVVLVKIGASQNISPAIINNPSSQTVSAGQKAAFNVVTTGTTPLTYQWQKNGVNIPGATASSYTTPATTTADSGAKFRCIVTNPYGSATSTAATLTVTQGGSNNQLLLLDRTFVHSTSYSAALLGETPSTTNSNCIYVLGISYSPGVAGNNVCNHEAFKFFQMPSANPGSWVSPINYAQGTLHQRVEIIEKPSTTAVRYAMCMFQDQVLAPRHACGDLSRMSFSNTGTYYSSQAMTSLYQYSTAIDWTRKPNVIMLHMTDNANHQPDTYAGFMDKWYGTPNWGLYYPMKLRYTAIIVPPGGGAPVWP